MTRNEKEQVAIFAGCAMFMFISFVWSVTTCPPWNPNEAWLVFGMEVAAALVPAYVLMRFARFLQTNENKV